MNRTRLTPKEHGILFSGEMVRAILDGSKTQTRRVVKWPVKCQSHSGRRRILTARDAEKLASLITNPGKHPDERPQCPYGTVGDRLWVKEKYLIETSGSCRYDAEGLSPGQYPDWLQRASIVHYAATTDIKSLGKWKPSIHMPRWASRLTLEIVSVKVERLQDISEEDARAEGIRGYPSGAYQGASRGMFRDLWESINGPGSWDLNPFVWAIEFKVVK